TATRERLMVLLFEAALRHMRAAQTAFEQGRKSDAVTACTKASDIVVELHSSLDRARAPELCDTLAAVYQFTCSRLLVAANTARVELVREAERAFSPLVSAFAEAVQKIAVTP
ncbi:MAG: flagellar protein FliS, partial [Deltaproteobacteria bacterium]|nr:flagellar protein FliS [Deltaproteobacteria bacterium]